MILQAAAQSCSLGFTLTSALLSGFVGSLGFFVNMFVIGGIGWIIRNKKHVEASDAVKRAVSGMLSTK